MTKLAQYYLSLLTALSLCAGTLAQQEPAEPDDSLIYITLEEHWVAPALEETFNANEATKLLRQADMVPGLFTNLRDVGPRRLANMTANRIRRQVVSHSSNPAALDKPSLVRQANDQLAANIANSTDRFSGFAYLPMAYPEVAAAELERCVRDLGFVGALVDTHLPNGTYYDGAAYRPFWAKAAELDVPVYLHPVWPDPALYTDVGVGMYAPAPSMDYSLLTASLLGAAAWGWHQDAGMHFLRLYSAGVFEEFPALKIVLGHMGEVVPFMLERADPLLSTNASRLGLADTYARNVWITTSAFFSLNPLATVLRNTAVDRVLYSVDYPFASSVRGSRFMAELRSSGMVTGEEWEMIAYKNAEALLKLK